MYHINIKELYINNITKAKCGLTQLVTDGKITEAQKQLIITKNNELQTARETNKTAFQNMTEEQRNAKMDEERAALEKWATDNGIDMQYLMMGRGGHGPHRR